MGRLMAVVSDPLAFAESLLLEPRTNAPFRANYVQRQILGAIRDGHRRVAVRVSRQTGKTYAMTILCLWSVLSRERRQVLVVAPDKSKVLVIFRNLDLFLQANPAISRFLERSYENPYVGREFTNGSVIFGFTTGTENRRGAKGVRGQSADVVIVDEADYLNPQDWVTLNPIIQGGLYRPNTIAVVSSTPNPYVDHSVFRDLFTKPGLREHWHAVHVPVTENPDFADRVELLRAGCPSELEWVTEYLAEFPQNAQQAFIRREDIDRAARDILYDLRRAKDGPCAIGVDWDKYSAGVNIVVVVYYPNSDRFEVVHREEMPPSDMLLTQAVARVLEIADAVLPEYIAVDRGYGEMQYETLRLEMRKRSMGAEQKVVGFSFSDLVDWRPLYDSETRRVRLKDASYSWMSYLIEQGKLVFPRDDYRLQSELASIQVKESDRFGLKFQIKNDHATDALALALWVLRDRTRAWKHDGPEVVDIPQIIPMPVSLDRSDHHVRVVTPSGGEPELFRSFTRSPGGRRF